MLDKWICLHAFCLIFMCVCVMTIFSFSFTNSLFYYFLFSLRIHDPTFWLFSIPIVKFNIYTKQSDWSVVCFIFSSSGNAVRESQKSMPKNIFKNIANTLWIQDFDVKICATRKRSRKKRARKKSRAHTKEPMHF